MWLCMHILAGHVMELQTHMRYTPLRRRAGKHPLPALDEPLTEGSVAKGIEDAPGDADVDPAELVSVSGLVQLVAILGNQGCTSCTTSPMQSVAATHMQHAPISHPTSPSLV